MFQTEVVETVKTYVLFNKFFSENHGVYGIMWENIVQPHRPQMIVQYSTKKM